MADIGGVGLCPPTQCVISGSCTSCPAGTYSWVDNIPNTCFPCPAGYASSVVGATSVAVCAACVAGTYSSPAASVCSTCAPGCYCPNNAQRYPIPCPAGTYSSATAATSSSTCVPCPAGYICPSAGQIAPVACPAGTFNPALYGASNASCQSCPAGAMCPMGGLTHPIPCPTNSYGPSIGATVCLSCPFQSHNNQTGSSSILTCECNNLLVASGGADSFVCAPGMGFAYLLVVVCLPMSAVNRSGADRHSRCGHRCSGCHRDPRFRPTEPLSRSSGGTFEFFFGFEFCCKARRLFPDSREYCRYRRSVERCKPSLFKSAMRTNTPETTCLWISYCGW
jgi:hypothetical protein